MRLSRQVKFLDAPDVLQGYGAFHGLVHSRIDMPEGMFLYGQPLFHGTVVGGAQDAHIERYSIQGCAIYFQPCLVFHYQVLIYIVQLYILVQSETHETGQSRRIGFRCAFPVQAFQLPNDGIHEVEERLQACLF